MYLIKPVSSAVWSLIFALVLLPSLTARASHAQQTAETEKSLQFGSEVDVVPYATGGYYGSGFWGISKEAIRFRYVVTRTNIPSFMVSDGFKDKRTDAYALLADKFIGAKRNKLQGLWVGGGAEYWRSRIRTDQSSVYSEYQNYLVTVGGGYVWRFSHHVYLNPWAGGHLVVAHDRDIHVADKVYKQPIFTPEASVKIGFTF